MPLFPALFAAGDSKSRWMGISLEGDDAVRVLDRIEIPTEIRRKIAEKLTPESSLIVADKSMNSAILPQGADFLVSTKDSPVVAQKPEAKPKHVQVAQAKTKRSKASAHRNKVARTTTFARRGTWDRGLYGFNTLSEVDRPRMFFRWRWRQCGGIGC